jgi:hypothetical protein
MILIEIPQILTLIFKPLIFFDLYCSFYVLMILCYVSESDINELQMVTAMHDGLEIADA